MVKASETAANPEPISLFLIVYSLDDKSELFSHQYLIAKKLNSHFSNTTVVTFFSKETRRVFEGMQVVSLDWDRSALLGVLKLYYFFFRHVRHNSNIVVFSHMADIASALISPFSRLLGVRHILWYAHNSYSHYLKFAVPFVDTILTSTPDSCPYVGTKLKSIGQGIDTALFSFSTKLYGPNFSRFIHVGRLDPSKQIDTILEAFSKFAKRHQSASLALVGAPTKGNESYVGYLKDKYHYLIETNQVIFEGAKKRNEVARILRESDLFIHAYEGSLDKSILEATLIGIPVVTLNRPYLNLVGASVLDQLNLRKSDLLIEQIEHFSELSVNEYFQVLQSRSELVKQSHNLDSWISKAVQVLCDS